MIGIMVMTEYCHNCSYLTEEEDLLKICKKCFDRICKERDEAEAIRRLNETTKQIGIKVGNGKLVKHQNVWYGFRRNMAAGSMFGFLISAISVLIGFYFLNITPMVVVSFTLLILYAAIFLMKGYIIKSAGEEYAKQLVAEFMMKNE